MGAHLIDGEFQSDNTYPTPEHGWTCFHCGEHFPGTFAGSRAAREHFGWEPTAVAACIIKGSEDKGLLRKLRGLEHANTLLEEDARRARSEDESEASKTYHRLTGEHAVALRRAEEEGYAKGLRDGRPYKEAEVAALAGLVGRLAGALRTIAMANPQVADYCNDFIREAEAEVPVER